MKLTNHTIENINDSEEEAFRNMVRLTLSQTTNFGLFQTERVCR